MEDEIFIASDKTKAVKALGVALNYPVESLHVYMNGVDITKSVIWEEIRVTAEIVKQEEKKP